MRRAITNLLSWVLVRRWVEVARGEAVTQVCWEGGGLLKGGVRVHQLRAEPLSVWLLPLPLL